MDSESLRALIMMLRSSNALSQLLLHLSQTVLVVTFRLDDFHRPVVSLPVDRTFMKVV